MRLGLGGVCNDSAVKRAVVDAFYKAYAERDVVAVAAFIGDDVEWTISGPIEALKFCGTYHGKAGLWELTMEVRGPKLPVQSMKQCTDAAADALMTYNFGGSAEHDCPKRDISTSGGVITIDSVCNFNGVTSTSHAVVSGDFNSAYTIEVTSKREGGRPIPGVAPTGETHMMIAAKYGGPCAAGQRPGDIVISNGMTMNVLDLQKGMPPRGAMPTGGAGRPPPPR
jgi:hypothetical protein